MTSSVSLINSECYTLLNVSYTGLPEFEFRDVATAYTHTHTHTACSDFTTTTFGLFSLILSCLQCELVNQDRLGSVCQVTYRIS